MRPFPALGSLAALFAVAIGAGLFVAPRPVEPAPVPERKVKLAVLVIFDQMRGDFPERWRALFGPNGFARLQRDGAWFTHCHYLYGTTTTGPGHASMLTGACPDAHGIVNNSWAEGGQEAYCAGSPRYKLVPPAPVFPVEPNPKDAKDKPAAKVPMIGSPERLQSETVADVLKEVHGAKSKVFGLSLKDRSAILPTGKHPDGAYWFYGTFGTSTYYTERVHPWVETFNQSKFADRWFGRDWTYFRPDVDYTRWSGQSDDVRGEGVGVGQRGTFPHPTTGGKPALGKNYYEALANSPFGNDLLLEFTKTCITAERLGADDAPDLLVVSFSSNDLIGHTWGPDSHEVMDVTLRSDALMADLLAFLDTNVGKDRYLLGMTADHGVCPLPEITFGSNPPRGRVNLADLRTRLEAHLTTKFPTPKPADGKPARWVEEFVFPWVYLNPRLVTASGQPQAAIAEEAAKYLRELKDGHVARAFTRTELAGAFPESDAMANRVKRSVYPSRSGDVFVVLDPHHLPASKPNETGTTHGAPFSYDTHVPLLVYGPGIRGGVRTEPTTPQALARIFSKWLNVRDPKSAAFPIPKTLE
ncbi:Alkaline phosphatase PhoV precursor [Gemmata sp. SH-PL17]|uniref:alkaline phosphatase family protein n=1 Tax=Gemmata sp. SH-PL17 TaxID=1630693 RepID=UPI00078E6D03|nr:alkaline phosphatase family protein [Gemmata sp. SH-PL17]AMV22938.1 Alkaline phosphatase PhoV precursor [Gemmata sp. SH-PL17]